jgi:hypothetical protein
MTAPLLLAYICAAVLSQLALGIGVAVWWRRGATAGIPCALVDQGPPVSVGAWLAWREFRVVRREFEDAAGTQCSFYLEPVDGTALPPFQPGQFLTFTLRVADAGSGLRHAVPSRAATRCQIDRSRPSTGSRSREYRPRKADRSCRPARHPTTFMTKSTRGISSKRGRRRGIFSLIPIRKCPLCSSLAVSASRQ